MQKSNLIRKGRKGFTLVEVALAVAVGLIVIGGAIVGFNAVRDNASNSAARQKVDAAIGIIENIAASRSGLYPQSTALNTATTVGSFSKAWKDARTDALANPWGGAAADNVDGVTELDQAGFGHASETLANAALAATPLVPSLDTPTIGGTIGAGNMLYQTAPGSEPWGVATDVESGTAKLVKGYQISLISKSNEPFWYLKGGK